MGKKKDKNKYKGATLRYGMVGIADGSTRDAMERYGIDRRNYTSSGAKAQGRVHGKGTYEDMEKDLIRAASSDYHTNRAIEAAALIGDKDAQKFAKNGIGNLGDLLQIQDMQKKMHKDLGNGGAFSSASDFAGLSFGMVQKDREMQTQGYRDEFASKDALSDLEDRLSKGGDVSDDFEPEKSEQTLKDEAVVDYWDENYASGGIYGDDSNKGPAMSEIYKDYGSPMLQPMINKREADEGSAANKFLSAYKKDLFQGGAALIPEIY